jgi:aspartyl-tRNA(Asn)/glutamyl-tRNA(Gln) amidotransferase subunit A
MMSSFTSDTIHLQSALAVHQAIQSGETTAVAVLDATFQQIESQDAAVGAFLSLTKDLAYDTATLVDQQVANGETLPLLAGVPIAVKDNISVTGTKTTCGSKILASYVAPYDATVVQQLKHRAMPIVGKTNLDEFAMGSSTENSAFQLTHNPWHLDKVPGGSSGGSAACVSAGMVSLSLGSDTGGSVRQPAALCGLVGLKPTYGLVSRFGLVSYASSLDQISPFARTVADVAALLDVITGYDAQDMTSARFVPTTPYVTSVQPDALPQRLGGRKLRVGVITKLNGEGMQPAVQHSFQQAIKQFEAQGAEVVPISIAGIREMMAAYYIIAPAEASSNLARFDGIRYGVRTEQAVANVYDLFRKNRSEGFGAEVKRRILLGTFALSSGYYDAYYGKAQAARRLLVAEFEKAWQQVDVLICPTSPTTAFDIGSKTDDPITMYLSDVATIPVNLAGIPALSLPCGFDEQHLPIGLQIMAPKFEETTLLGVAALFESAVGLSNLVPPAFAPAPSSTVC